MAVYVESRFGEIADRAEERAALIVQKTVLDIEAAAKANLIGQGSVDTGFLLGSIEGHADGFFGDVSVGAHYGAFVELGTGARGAAYEFPGKPQGIEYDMDWLRGIPKDPAHGFAFLIPAVEEAHGPFVLACEQLFG